MSNVKKIAMISTLIAGGAVGTANAQSSVTLYGLMDEGLRYSTHVNTGNGSKSQFSLQEGAFSGPRWGLRIAEDLGSGMKALALLESGFNTNTGKSDQQGQLFGRQAYVGISAPGFGQLRAGRQYGAVYNLMATLDPISTGNIAEDDWNDFLTGLRFDNTLDYTNNLGPINLDLQYSTGNQAGSTTVGRTIAAALSYVGKWGTVGVAAHESRDAANRKVQVGFIGAKGTYKNANIFGYYVHSTKEAGFTVGTSGTTLPLANISMTSNYSTVGGTGTQTAGRLDRLYLLGANYHFTPAFTLTSAWMVDYAHGLNGPDSGRTQTYYVTGVYSLSKRTDVYAEVDYDRLSGGAKTDVNGLLAGFGGANTRLGTMLGLRVKF